MEAIVVLISCPNEAIAGKLARTLVDERLAACVNILPGMRSVYRWRGAIESESELLCLVKSTRAQFEAVKERVLGLHPYEVPEVVAIPIVLGHSAYLDWLLASVG